MRLVGISPQQFAQMKERMAGARRKAAPVFAKTPQASASAHQIILGIDPSLRGTGYGIIRLAKPFPETLAQGTIDNPSHWPRSLCLLNIAETLRAALKAHHPTVCAVEGLFFAQNLQTALLMGEARGVCLLAAAEVGLEIFEIAARRVKLAIVGYGAAQKLAVAKMVQRLLHLPSAPDPDAADALALALAYAQENRALNFTPLKRI
jgi:crossover junction endodeoxyribonuclease RuvC